MDPHTPPDPRAIKSEDDIERPITPKEWAMLVVIVIAAAILAGAIVWGLSYLPGLLARAVHGLAYYLDVGPGCPGADYGFLGRCGDLPKGGA